MYIYHAYLNKTAAIGFVWVNMTLWWTPCIILLSYGAWWPVGWYSYLKKAVDFADYVWHFTGCSALCICLLVNSVRWKCHAYSNEVAVLFGCVCGHLWTLCIVYLSPSEWKPLMGYTYLNIGSFECMWLTSGYHTLEPYTMFVRLPFRYLTMSLPSRTFSCV